MNPPTLVELRTAVAVIQQKRQSAIPLDEYSLAIAQMNLLAQLNAKLEQELAKAQDFGPKFLNCLKAINFIDRDQLPELSEHEWRVFVDNPTHYTIRANDEQQAAILREIAKSQHPTTT